MNEAGPSALSHVSLGTNNYGEAVAFYDRILPVLGLRKIMEHPGATAYGRQYPEFWIQKPFDGHPASPGNGIHVGFFALTRQAVDEFFEAALAAGAKADGDPGHRGDYGEPYYGCFVRDLDGNKIEATFWDFELATKLGMA